MQPGALTVLAMGVAQLQEDPAERPSLSLAGRVAAAKRETGFGDARLDPFRQAIG